MTTYAIGTTTTTQAGDLANQATAVRPAKVPMNDVDLLDPESMMAFFQLQMSDVRQKLNIAMQDQQKRNEIIKTLTSLQSDLTAYKANGIGPKDAGWPDFQAKIEKVRALLGPMEGAAVAKLLDKASAFQSKEFAVLDSKDAANYAAANPGATITTSGDKLVVSMKVTTDEIDSIIGQVKGFTDSLTAENQMNMIRVQQHVESSSQLTNLCSNIMKKISDAAMAPINNMR